MLIELSIVKELRDDLEKWSAADPAKARRLRSTLRVLGAVSGAAVGAFIAYIVAQKLDGPPPVDNGYIVFGALIGLVPGYLFYFVALYVFAFFFFAVSPGNIDAS